MMKTFCILAAVGRTFVRLHWLVALKPFEICRWLRMWNESAMCIYGQRIDIGSLEQCEQVRTGKNISIFALMTIVARVKNNRDANSTFFPVFSNWTNLPSPEISAIATGPLALRWYVVLADISPLVTWLTLAPSAHRILHSVTLHDNEDLYYTWTDESPWMRFTDNSEIITGLLWPTNGCLQWPTSISLVNNPVVNPI